MLIRARGLSLSLSLRHNAEHKDAKGPNFNPNMKQRPLQQGIQYPTERASTRML